MERKETLNSEPDNAVLDNQMESKEQENLIMNAFTPFDELTNSQRWKVFTNKSYAASRGWGVDFLKDDRSRGIRREVARWGCALDELKDDSDPIVRSIVAQQGYAPEQLSRDRNKWVRESVAQSGHALDELYQDPEPIVRREVARQGYALDELAHDRSWFVRRAVRRRLAYSGLALEDWIAQNPGKCVLRESKGPILFAVLNPEESEVQGCVEGLGERMDGGGIV